MAFFDVVRGLGDAPAVVVGFARGAVEAAVLAGLGAFAVYVGDYDFAVLGISEDVTIFALPAVLWVVRTVEGDADQIDPSK